MEKEYEKMIDCDIEQMQLEASEPKFKWSDKIIYKSNKYQIVERNEQGEYGLAELGSRFISKWLTKEELLLNAKLDK